MQRNCKHRETLPQPGRVAVPEVEQGRASPGGAWDRTPGRSELAVAVALQRWLCALPMTCTALLTEPLLSPLTSAAAPKERNVWGFGEVEGAEITLGGNAAQ